MSQFTPQTLSAIEGAIPSSDAASAIDIWKACGCKPSHQHVKNALKLLYEQGKVARRQERNGQHHRFLYTKVNT